MRRMSDDPTNEKRRSAVPGRSYHFADRLNCRQHQRTARCILWAGLFYSLVESLEVFAPAPEKPRGPFGSTSIGSHLRTRRSRPARPYCQQKQDAMFSASKASQRCLVPIRPNETCPIHRSLSCCGREPVVRIRVLEDEPAPLGSRCTLFQIENGGVRKARRSPMRPRHTGHLCRARLDRTTRKPSCS